MAIVKSAKSTKTHTNALSHARSSREGDSSILQVDELDESYAPPIPSKVHPQNAMDDVVPTLDDSDREFFHHPNESVGEGFSFDPGNADAAADLAGELGADFVEGATRGRDMSDVMFSEEDVGSESSFVIEMIGENDETYTQEDALDDIEMPLEKTPHVAHTGSEKHGRR